MREVSRSGCPINLTLENIGGRWSLISSQAKMRHLQATFIDIALHFETYAIGQPMTGPSA